MKNNRINGIAMGITGVPMFNLQDVVKLHVVPTGDSLGYTGTSFIMNRKKFEGLPPEVQKIINDNVFWASNRITEIEVNNLPKQVDICDQKIGIYL